MSQDQMEQTRFGNNPLSHKEIILLEWNDSYLWLGHRKNRKITMLAVEAFNLSTKTPIFSDENHALNRLRRYQNFRVFLTIN